MNKEGINYVFSTFKLATSQRAFAKDDLVAIIPIGSTEQHGPVGPLGTDFLIPDYFAKQIEKRTRSFDCAYSSFWYSYTSCGIFGNY